MRDDLVGPRSNELVGPVRYLWERVFSAVLWILGLLVLLGGLWIVLRVIHWMWATPISD